MQPSRLAFVMLSLIAGAAGGYVVSAPRAAPAPELRSSRQGVTPAHVRKFFRDGLVEQSYALAIECVEQDAQCRPLAIEVKNFLIDSRPLEGKTAQQLEVLVQRAIAIAQEDGSRPVAELRALAAERRHRLCAREQCVPGEDCACAVLREGEDPGRDAWKDPYLAPAAAKLAAELAAQNPGDADEQLAVAMRVFYMTAPGTPLRKWAERKMKKGTGYFSGH